MTDLRQARIADDRCPTCGACEHPDHCTCTDPGGPDCLQHPKATP